MLRWISFLPFLVIGITFNWPYVYEEVLNETMTGTVHLMPVTGEVSTRSATTYAGWPARFYVSNSVSQLPTLTGFDTLALLINIGFWGGLTALFVVYQRFFGRKPAVGRVTASTTPEINSPLDIDTDAISSRTGEGPVQSRPKKTTQLSDIFAITAIIAAVFGYWQSMRHRATEDLALARRISSAGGGATRTAMLPYAATKLLRVGGFEGHLRIRDVRLQNPDDALVREVASLPNLRTLIILGGTYDFSSLSPLAGSTQLEELRIVARQLDSKAIQAIRAIHSVQKIDLMRTNITAAGVAALRNLPRLVEMNLVHSDVQLAGLNASSLAPTLQRISLPHPSPGTGDSLELDGCPNLTEIICFEYDELLNASPVSITLRNMPKLRKLEIDLLQLADLDLQDLPAFEEATANITQWEMRTSVSQTVPSELWIRKLHIKNVPKLNEISIFPTHLESISIDNPNALLRLRALNSSALRTNLRTNRTISYSTGESAEPGYLTSKELPQKLRQQWIVDIGNCTGIKQLSLDSIPLGDINLDPLAKNSTLRDISMGRSGMSRQQIAGLSKLNQLNSMVLRGLEVDGALVESFAKSMPNLRELQCDRGSIQRLRLERVPQLMTVYHIPEKPKKNDPFAFMDDFGWVYLDALRLVDMPALTDYFESTVPMQHLHIESAPAVTGLSFEADLPSNAVIKGVRDLKFFAAGGPTCTDALVKEVLECSGLQKLTLAYAPLSAASLSKIAQLQNLEYLVLTGTPVEDSVIQSLAGMPKLHTLRLGKTKVSRAAVGAMAQIPALQVLILNDIALTADDTLLLAKKHTQLKELGVSGTELSLDAVNAIASISGLATLDLSGCQLTQEFLMAMAQKGMPSLKVLKLNAAQVDDNGLTALIRQLPNLQFELNNTIVSPQLTDYLMSESRMIEPEDPGMNRRVRIFRSSSDSTVAAPKPGEIDESVFAPLSEEELAEQRELDRTRRGNRSQCVVE